MTSSTTPAGHALTHEQRRAVEHDSGPLIVLAGPGTGKTRVIIHRVARLIASGVEPDSIVAVTFTVRAAEELRHRLAALVNGPAADAVRACTFHALGLELVRRYADALGLPAELRLMDSADLRRELREADREHDVLRSAKGDGRDAALDDVAEIISKLRHQGLTPDGALALVERWRRALDEDVTFDEIHQKAELKRWSEARRQETERAKLLRFEEAVRLYGHFRRRCLKRGLLAMDDLMLLPAELLGPRGDDRARAIVRGQYRHFVVDEFQDVNVAQIELLRGLAPPGKGRNGPDLCVVGDDDQAIYGFRGSDDRAFSRFDTIWPGATRVTLGANYRSRPAIVHLAAAVIGRARRRFDPEKLVAPGPREWKDHETRGESVEAVTVEDTHHDAAAIAAMILAERARDPRPWSSYAVIARSKDDLQRIADALLLEGIPIRRARAASPMDDPGVQDLMRWVRLIVRGDLEAAIALLTRPPVDCPVITVKAWHDDFRAQRRRRRLADPDVSSDEPNDTAWGFFDWLDARARALGERGPLAARLGALARDLASRTASLPPSLALATIAREADLIHADLLPGRERRDRIAHLARVMRFAAERDRRLGPGLEALLEHIEDLDERDQRLDGPEDPVDRDEGPLDSRDDAVTFVTAHSAKGLEFDTVFIPNLKPGSFPSSYKGPEPIPDHLLRPPTDPSPKERSDDEERRLFYVAVTRAIRRVIVLARSKKSRGSSADFFYEVIDQPGTIRRTAEEVLRAAAELGVTVSGGSVLDAPADSTPTERRRAVLWASRRDARAAAADALELADRPGVTPDELASIASRLADAARRLAITAAVDHSGHAPTWATGQAAPKADRDLAARLESALAARPVSQRGHPVFRPLTSPLRVSYSWIEEFGRCPRCFYMRRVIGWPEPTAKAQSIGTLIHGVLERFANERRRADAEGHPPPDQRRLHAIARDVAQQAAAEPELLETLTAQLENFHQQLHHPADDIEAAEFSIRFPYCLDDATHTIEVKIDRVDRRPAGGHRVIDYKSGKPSNKLLRPEEDDLQLGVYALAIAHHQGCASPGEAVGEAQYWVLSTGERGTLRFENINFTKIKSQIDKAIRGMLQGEFPRGKEGFGNCWGLCQIAGD